MPTPMVTTMNCLRVPHVPQAKGACQRRLELGYADDMDVIRHQTIPPNLQTITKRILPEKLQIYLIIGISVKHLLAVIPALGDMIGNPDKDIAKWT